MAGAAVLPRPAISPYPLASEPEGLSCRITESGSDNQEFPALSGTGIRRFHAENRGERFRYWASLLKNSSVAPSGAYRGMDSVFDGKSWSILCIESGIGPCTGLQLAFSTRWGVTGTRGPAGWRRSVSLNPSADPPMETMIVGRVLELGTVLRQARVGAAVGHPEYDRFWDKGCPSTLLSDRRLSDADRKAVANHKGREPHADAGRGGCADPPERVTREQRRCRARLGRRVAHRRRDNGLRNDLPRERPSWSWANPLWQASRRILIGITCSGTPSSATRPVTVQPTVQLRCEICYRTRTGRPASPRGYHRKSPRRYRWTCSASLPVCLPKCADSERLKSGLSSIKRTLRAMRHC